MSNILIVDDEKFVVQSLCTAIDWSSIGIGEVFSAYDVSEALDILKKEKIAVAICDIEMLGGTGLEICEWVNKNQLDTRVIILTGHADFRYAQRALKLGSVDYLLKPVDHGELLSIVEREIGAHKEQEEKQAYFEVYKKGYALWESQLPLLVERFWQDIIGNRTYIEPERILHMSETYRIGITYDTLVLPALISVNEWEEPLATSEEEAMEYGIRNIAGEMLLKDFDGAVVRDDEDNDYVLFYFEPGKEKSPEDLLPLFSEFVENCAGSLRCELCVYVGKPCGLKMLSKETKRLAFAEKSNLKEVNRVIVPDESERGKDTILTLPNFNEWGLLFEAGQTEALMEHVSQYAESLSGEINAETVEALGYGVVNLVYNAFAGRGQSVHRVYGEGAFQNARGLRSRESLLKWIQDVLRKGSEALNESAVSDSSVVSRIKRYIMEHSGKDITREDISAYVHLNPAYVSRLFKKETGLALSDYVMHVRIENAKRLLTQSDEKISIVAEKAGYYNPSYFAKLFRKVVGITPQEYRRQREW